MNSLLHSVAALTVFSAVVLVAPAWSAQQTADKPLPVNQLAAKPAIFLGRVAVVGRVAAATPGKGFTLIDSVNCSTCTTQCLTDKTTGKIPFLWGGVTPALKNIVQVKGTLAKSAKGFTFTADSVTEQ